MCVFFFVMLGDSDFENVTRRFRVGILKKNAARHFSNIPKCFTKSKAWEIIYGLKLSFMGGAQRLRLVPYQRYHHTKLLFKMCGSFLHLDRFINVLGILSYTYCAYCHFTLKRPFNDNVP